MRASTMITILTAATSLTSGVAGVPVEHEIVEKDVVVVVETVTVAVTKLAGGPQYIAQPAPVAGMAVDWSEKWGGRGHGDGWGRGKGAQPDNDQQGGSPPASVPAEPVEPAPFQSIAPPPDTLPEPDVTQAQSDPEPTTAAAQPEPSPNPPPAETQQQATPPSEDDQAKILAAHNEYRAACPGAKQMHWDNDLAAAADEWAKTCTLGHPSNREINGKGYGQNVAQVGSTSADFTYDIDSMFKQWTNEFGDYAGKGAAKPAGPDGKERMIGHYTQVVWRDSDALGCSIVKCDGAGVNYNLVCNYGPPGNYGGQYADQVDKCWRAQGGA